MIFILIFIAVAIYIAITIIAPDFSFVGNDGLEAVAITFLIIIAAQIVVLLALVAFHSKIILFYILIAFISWGAFLYVEFRLYKDGLINILFFIRCYFALLVFPLVSTYLVSLTDWIERGEIQ